MTVRFADLAPSRPTRESLLAAYATLHGQLDLGERDAALAAWDRLRRAYDDWSALVHLRYAQDTTEPDAKAERAYADGLAPEATDLESAFKQRLLSDPDRAGLERVAGGHAVRLWANDVTTFDPAIKADLAEESALSARYTALLAGAAIEVDGATVNLSGLAPYTEHPDRATRHRAEQARWAFFADHGAELDGIFDDLVRLRHGMAQKLGEASFTPLGYRRMRRVDYGPEDVARYRDEVVAHVVPLVGALLEQQRCTHGWDRLRFWDEALIDPAGNPAPAGDHDFLLVQAQTMFDRMGPALGGFFRSMNAGGFLDLRNRPGKAGGGFCTSFPTIGMPFIFANFNATHQDIGVFTHEMGHALQNHESRGQPGIDYLWPTMEAAEINSMGLEFLTWPHMALMVGEAAADRFRRMHLIGSLAFLPYGACVDHFQHLVYATPAASPAERHAMWRGLEQRYMPWTEYGDLAYPAMGGRWQAKQHIYRSPFYYIDYTLALCCAMQFWVRSRRDGARTLATFVKLCGMGGSLPFGALVQAAGLRSPFEAGALEEVVTEAKTFLGIP